jgi:CheY-like chemotaxis protein
MPKILWIEEQWDEYFPLNELLGKIVGEENVQIAENQDDGVNYLKNISFDLVIMDIMLPRNKEQQKYKVVTLEAGINILRDLRNNTDWQTSPSCNVIALTARGNPEPLNLIQTLLGEKGKLIGKPAVIDAIIDQVKQYLGF